MLPRRRGQPMQSSLSRLILFAIFGFCHCFSVSLNFAHVGRLGKGQSAGRIHPCRPSRTPPVISGWKAQLQFYQAKDIQVNWKNPQARGNFGNVYYGTTGGQPCVVKCPILDEFSLRLFDTERAVNIKLNTATSGVSVPWPNMLGEVNIPENIAMPQDVARIGIVWRKEGDGSTLEDYLQNNKDLYKALKVPAESAGSIIRPELSRAVMAQLLLALLQMQDKGIMHRDIKPSNTLVVPGDPKHTLKIIDFGSSCDWSDPFKMGLGDATNDPMYAAPEQTLSLTGPGKFDVYSVGMSGMRILLPSFTKGGVTKDWPGGRFQKFAELDYPGMGHDLKAWLKKASMDTSEGKLAAECKELLERDVNAKLIDLLQNMLTKNVLRRPSAQAALDAVGGSFAAEAQQQLKGVRDAEAAIKEREKQSARTGAERERDEEERRKQAERDEEKRKEIGAGKALSAAQKFLDMQKQLKSTPSGSAQSSNPFAGLKKLRSDKDIANVVPDDWQEGKDFFRSSKLSFSKGEMVVSFRSDGSRRFGKIMQDYGDQTYDILVDREGGEGVGQFRTDRGSSIGKIATGRTLQEEEEASKQGMARLQRAERRIVVKNAKLGDKVPVTWQVDVDINFSPTSFFKPNEIVVAARADGSLRFGSVSKVNGDGTLEVSVDGKQRRIFFVGSLGKILI